MSKSDSEHPEDLKLTAAQQQALLRCLNQQTAAWALGKSTTWIRDNNHLFERSADGMYDARNLIKAVADREAVNLEMAPIADEHLGPLLRFTNAAASGAGRLPGISRVLNEVEAAHGGAGLAAIGALLKEAVEEHLPCFPFHVPDEEELRAKHTKQLAEELAEVPYIQAAHQWRVVDACEKHRRFRWGRDWKPYPIPQGYFPDKDGDECDECQLEDKHR